MNSFIQSLLILLVITQINTLHITQKSHNPIFMMRNNIDPRMMDKSPKSKSFSKHVSASPLQNENKISVLDKTPPHMYLIHVPKSAGSAVTTYMRHYIGCHPPGFCCVKPGDPRGSCNETRLGCGRIGGCTGHAGFLQSQLQKFVVLSIRDPLDRSLSGLFYPGHHGVYSARNIDQYFEEPIFQGVIRKMLSGFSPYTRINERTRLLSLRDMMEMVNRIDIVVLSEYFELCMHLMYDRLNALTGKNVTVPHGMGEVFDHSRLNAHKPNINLTDDQYSLFYNNNKEDILLYHWILEKFKKDPIVLEKAKKLSITL